MHDVIVIGGSYAGMSATLQLARARRDVLVIDGGQRRNRTATHAHGLLGFDGVPPDEIAAKGRADVLAYDTVRWRDGEVDEVRAIAGGFVVRTAGALAEARRLILATGVLDELPDVPGLRERWGRSVFHCPYCHGYELQRGRIGVLMTPATASHFVPLVAEWGTTTLFTDGAPVDDELAARGIRIERERVRAVEGGGPGVTVRLHDGRTVDLDGLFAVPHVRPAGPFAAQLGCALEEGPMGSVIATDAMKQTTVPGVFACGDVARPMASLALAIGDGMLTGASVHRSLVFDA